MCDKYLEKFKSALKKAKNGKEVDDILNKIYSDGFEDGANEG